MIEVVVAAVVLAVGALATFGVLSAAIKNAQRGKATQVALNLAQEEMEELHRLRYDQLGLTRLPSASASPLNPNNRISGSGIEFALHRDPLGDYAPLVRIEDGMEPESTFRAPDAEHGGVSGTVFRYVVQRETPGCAAESCQYKQVVVAVKLDAPGGQSGERGYVEVQSKFSAPVESEPEAPPAGGDAGGVTAQQFFLTDTPCAATGSTVRQDITGDHLLHNTLGTCASGPQAESVPGAPDALLVGSPPDPAPEDESLPRLYDYSNDFYLEPTPDTDKGLQIRRDDTSGCYYEPTGTANPESQVHRWVTDPMPANFKLTGNVTLEFYTRTLNDALYTGGLCVYLFDRHEEAGSEGLPKPHDDLLVDADKGVPFWVYIPKGNQYWPRNAWTKVRLTMEIEGIPEKIDKDDRLGLALSVDPAKTQADAIPIMYDHPNYPSRLEVDTTTPLEGG